MKWNLKIVGYDEFGKVIYEFEQQDLGTKQFAQLCQLNILDTAETITDTSNTGRALTVNNAAIVPTIIAGTGTTTPTVLDYNLTTPTAGASGTVAATINAYSGSGASGNFTVTGTITNSSGSSITYAEVGITVTVATYVFLITHDTFTGVAIPNTGLLGITYTCTVD